MAQIKIMDSKMVTGVAISVAAVSTGIAVYSSYNLWVSHQNKKKENVYETERLKTEYLMLHYGSPNECMLWDFGPRNASEFPKRCAELCIKHFDEKYGAPKTALDVGCAVGRSTFELARQFRKVIGVDYSENFIKTCDTMKDDGFLPYSFATEGSLDQMYVARVDPSLNRSSCDFQVGDACCLSADLKQFGCVLAANLICRLPRPHMFLFRCADLVATGGLLVITSPYTFMTEYTAPEHMIGGYIRNGTTYTGFNGLKAVLETAFDLIAEEEIPFLIRETKRKHQWTVTHATVWRRK